MTITDQFSKVSLKTGFLSPEKIRRCLIAHEMRDRNGIRVLATGRVGQTRVGTRMGF